MFDKLSLKNNHQLTKANTWREVIKVEFEVLLANST